MTSYLNTLPELRSLLQNASHLDIKTVEGNIGLRQFLANMLAYQPGWVSFLYRVRAVFVRLLGMKQEGVPTAPRYSAETVPMTPGEKAAFFTVKTAREDQYFFAEVRDQHLDAMLGVVVEPLGGNRNRFHVVTVVHYNNWAGPVYFNVIRPFHHIVVGSMARAGVGI
jgi:hypothetical protein